MSTAMNKLLRSPWDYEKRSILFFEVPNRVRLLPQRRLLAWKAREAVDVLSRDAKWGIIRTHDDLASSFDGEGYAGPRGPPCIHCGTGFVIGARHG